MSIGSISAYAADRGLSAPSAMPREDAEPEPVIAPPRLQAASNVTGRTPLVALRDASEAERFNTLVAAARAAAVRLVTEPVATAPTEKTKTVAERPDGSAFPAALQAYGGRSADGPRRPES